MNIATSIRSLYSRLARFQNIIADIVTLTTFLAYMLAPVPPPTTPIPHLATFHQCHVPPQTPSPKDTQLPHQDLGDVVSRRHNPGNQKASHAPSAENTRHPNSPPKTNTCAVPSRTHAQPAVHDTSKPRSAGILPQIPAFLPPEHPR
ncbi:hypothetical protein BDP81DRAFT_435505 [Colletotrichum phormii]|uniref:Uncharacterized protein n=1 Tax=Colletotrichum phormii TaxID=359342 RepID=A0AAI9ZL61_9PEZI|nr:uncharacterized protein BDP81DRAFT_435505 [Colletotrichum phormii]KAK1625284.1 hypothetical protein BDP81DRAFT_435505 [Colletotrichum phormii]